jgi:hypothetical protein
VLGIVPFSERLQSIIITNSFASNQLARFKAEIMGGSDHGTQLDGRQQ